MTFPDHLKIVVFSKVKQFRINETYVKENRILDKIDVEMTKTLAQTLKFSYEFSVPEDGEFGKPLPNGSWDGMISMVLKREADLIVSRLTLTEERSKALDTTYPYNRVRMTFATRNPEYVPCSTVFLKPFSVVVWICTILSIALITLAFYKIFSTKHSLKKLMLVSYGTILRQSLYLQPRKYSDYILVYSLGVAAMLLSNFYSAVLLSFLSFPPLSGVRTIPELATAVVDGTYECKTFPGSFIMNALATANDPDAEIIGQNLLKNKGSSDIDAVLNNSTSSKKSAFISSDRTFKMLATKYFVSEDEFLPSLQTIFMRKDFCCKQRLNRFVSSLWSSGINKKIVSDQVFLTSLEAFIHSGKIDQEKNERSLTIEDFKGAFIILINGYTLAIVIFIFEIVLKQRISIPCFES